jgi:CheY-like chemotaxis protein/anti-sigma regulatory factor (Ser/Thr protein kinase)
VDDGPVDRRMAGTILGKEPSLRAIYAEHGRQALEQIEASPPDVVLTDIQMPEMDGLTLVTEIRRRFPFLPVILMTAHGSEDTAIDALRQGAASYVPKRRLARDLIETIEGVLAAAQYGREQHRLFESWLHSEYSFSLDNDPALLGRMVAQAQQYLREQPGFDETTIIRIGVALLEALTNAMHHGNLELDSAFRDRDGDEYDELLRQRLNMEPYRSRRIHVSIRETPQEGRYVIRDEGRGFDTASLVVDPTDPEHLERPHGRGLFLIRAFMDEVEHNSAGNEITMVHRHRTGAN